MKKDIIIPEVKDVHIAILEEFNEESSSNEWSVYLINNSDQAMESVMVMSRGKHRDGRKTTTFRHAFPLVAAHAAIKVELIMEDVFPFLNEFVLTYFIGATLYDATFMAAPNTISESNFSKLPVMNVEGFLLK